MKTNSIGRYLVWFLFISTLLYLSTSFASAVMRFFSFVWFPSIKYCKDHLTCENNNFQTNFQKKRITWGGFDCSYNPETNVTFGSCNVTSTSKTSGRVYLQLNFSEPIHALYLHVVLHRMSATGVYRKFAIDFWENVCGWLDGTVKSSLLDATIGKTLNYSETNINHKCPFEGYVYVKTANLSLSKFPIANINMDLVPTGSYRADGIWCDNVDGQWYAGGMIYFNVSAY